MTPAVFGYLLAAAAYLLLTVLLIRSRRFGWPYRYLLATTVLLTIWAVTLAWRPLETEFYRAIVLLEGLHAFALMLFIGQLVGKRASSGWQRVFLWLPWLIIVIAAGLYTYSEVSSVDVFAMTYYLIVAISLAGLLGVEQLYRNSSRDKRDVSQLIGIAFGAVFVFDLFVYSNSILISSLDTRLWAARGFVNAMAAPLLFLALKRDPNWQSGFFVSRQVVFYSTSLVGVGAYLLLVAFGGAIVQQAGGDWGSVLKFVFFAASLTLLALVLFSRAMRRRLKVFLATHFYANRYDYREQWLNLIRRLAQDSRRAPMPDLCLEALADIVDSDGGVLWLRAADDTGDFQSAASFGYHVGQASLPADHALVRFMAETGWVIDGDEAVRDPEHYSNALVNLPELVTRDVLFVPVVFDDALTGVACLNRPSAMQALNFEDHDLLRTVGRQLAVFLEQSRVQEHLTHARQFEVFNRFSAFVMHDLKNLIAQQSLVVANAKKFKHNPEFVEDAIGTIENSVKRMNRLLEQLQTGRTGSTIRTADVADLVSRVCADAADRAPLPELDIVQPGQRLPLFGDIDKLRAAIHHLLRNAQDATPADGSIRVVLDAVFDDGDATRPTRCVLTISDTGVGMSDEFIERHLFEPFYSTKGAQGMGIGVYQARDHVSNLGGTLSVASTLGEGTTFTIELPLTYALHAAARDD